MTKCSSALTFPVYPPAATSHNRAESSLGDGLAKRSPSSSVLLVQISDSHLFAEADGALLGMSTRDSLEKVVDLVLAEQPQVDLVVASGDISQDGSVESYEAFRRISTQIAAPRAGLPVIMMNCRRWSRSHRLKGCLSRSSTSAGGG